MDNRTIDELQPTLKEVQEMLNDLMDYYVDNLDCAETLEEVTSLNWYMWDRSRDIMIQAGILPNKSTMFRDISRILGMGN